MDLTVQPIVPYTTSMAKYSDLPKYQDSREEFTHHTIDSILTYFQDHPSVTVDKVHILMECKDVDLLCMLIPLNITHLSITFFASCTCFSSRHNFFQQQTDDSWDNLMQFIFRWFGSLRRGLSDRSLRFFSDDTRERRFGLYQALGLILKDEWLDHYGIWCRDFAKYCQSQYCKTKTHLISSFSLITKLKFQTETKPLSEALGITDNILYLDGNMVCSTTAALSTHFPNVIEFDMGALDRSISLTKEECERLKVQINKNMKKIKFTSFYPGWGWDSVKFLSRFYPNATIHFSADVVETLDDSRVKYVVTPVKGKL